MFQSPIPPYLEVPPMGPFETWLNLFIGVLALFSLVLLILPRAWFVAVFRAAFPFMPDRLEDLDKWL